MSIDLDAQHFGEPGEPGSPKATDDLQQARIEAAARAMYEFRELRTDPKWADVEHGVQEEYRKDARKALAAADAVCCKHLKCPGGSLCCCRNDAMVTVEQIAEVLYDEFVTRTDLSMVECERAACAVRALFGEEAGDVGVQ